MKTDNHDHRNQLLQQQQKEQQQHQQQPNQNQHSTNLQAQQASFEAISISRSTLQITQTQGEQLNHCHDLQIRNDYINQKSNRLIRGMTWRGWIQNLISRDIEPPPGGIATHSADTNNNNNNNNSSNSSNNSSTSTKNIHHDNNNIISLLQSVPTQLLKQASFITNYNSNVLLLQQCTSGTNSTSSTIQDYKSCLDICNKSKIATEQCLLLLDQRQRNTHISTTHTEDDKISENVILEWEKKLVDVFQQIQELHSSLILSQEELELIFSNNSRNNRNTNAATTRSSNSNIDNQSGDPFAKLISKATTTTKSQSSNQTLHTQFQEQEDHIDILSNNIQELLHNTASISMVLDEQNSILDSLNDGADDLIESTKMVSRKADRVKNRSLWRYPKSDYKCSVLIQHVPSQKYLTIQPSHGNKVILQSQPSDASIFEVHERRSSIHKSGNQKGSGVDEDSNDCLYNMIGFCNKCTRTWLGQSTFLGNVDCSARKFGKNEEWELDDGLMIRTRILCASANWGSGGWLNVVDNNTNGSFLFGGYDVTSKKKASLWSLVVLSDDND